MSRTLEVTDPKRNLWQCPCCGGYNAWNWQDAERAEELTGEPFAVSHGSSFDNVCGHCQANLVPIDSPILAECYARIDYSEAQYA